MAPPIAISRVFSPAPLWIPSCQETSPFEGCGSDKVNPMQIKPWKITLLAIPFILLACAQLDASPVPPATPTQSVRAVTDFDSGISEIPPEQLIFVLVKNHSSGSGSCDFPVVEQSPLAFKVSSRILTIDSAGSSSWLSDENLVPVTQPEIVGLGYFGFYTSRDYSLGGGINNALYLLDQLPYSVSSFSLVIYSVLKDGSIVAGVKDQVYQFEPGQSWVEVSTINNDSQPDCRITSTLSITNYGLLQSSDIKFEDDPILP